VVPKKPDVPDEVTAGGPTVALRCPNHPVARELILAAGVPIAAPSANRSTELSPTCAAHVLKGLGGHIDLILDGGPCNGGIESTVVDATGSVVRLLRLGLITVPMLEEIVGKVEVVEKPDTVARSPGQMAKHYSPRTPVRLVEGIDLVDDFLEARNVGKNCGMMTLPSDPSIAAAELYATLHRLDESAFDLILIEMPPDTPEWAAVRDRLMRAAAK
jgi:L-threonylcarbamoyladenylate synthase